LHFLDFDCNIEKLKKNIVQTLTYMNLIILNDNNILNIVSSFLSFNISYYEKLVENIYGKITSYKKIESFDQNLLKKILELYHKYLLFIMQI
jgi:hypothetical protein